MPNDASKCASVFSQRTILQLSQDPRTLLSAASSLHADSRLKHRQQAALAADSAEYDYLRDELARRLLDRLNDITREFPVALDLGANTANIAKLWQGEGGIKKMYMLDSSGERVWGLEGAGKRAASKTGEQVAAVLQERSAGAADGMEASLLREAADAMLYCLFYPLTLHLAFSPLPPPLPALPPIGAENMLLRDKAAWQARSDIELIPVTQDEEARLPFEDGSLDIVLSGMSLQWVNNVPAVLAEVRRVLKPDGVFLAAFLGGDTLCELRSSFIVAEQDRDGGVSPHMSPLMMVTDAGNLLQSAGFAIPTIDSDVFTIEYPSPGHLFTHLQKMGDSNVSLGMRGGARPDTLLAAAAAYQSMYGSAEDGSVPASFQVIYWIGWAPSASQPKALKRGSVPKGFTQKERSVSAGAGTGAGAAGAAAGREEEESGDAAAADGGAGIEVVISKAGAGAGAEAAGGSAESAPPAHSCRKP